MTVFKNVDVEFLEEDSGDAVRIVIKKAGTEEIVEKFWIFTNSQDGGELAIIRGDDI